jgi:3',5'-cyclic AMP phosphodiesterase CpdA
MIKILRLLAAFIFFGSLARAEEPWFFIQLSDPQMGMFSNNADSVQDAANFEFAVATINRLKPAFVIITGDLTNKWGDAAQIAEFKRIVAKVDGSIPVYNAPGNHDVANLPTPATVGAYLQNYGPDHYTFQHKNLTGIVLNSTLIHTPEQVRPAFAQQEQWLRDELAKAKAAGAKHIVVFQHHPWFIKTPDEADEYFNIPLERRGTYLRMFHEAGVRYLFSGHHHRDSESRDGEIETIITGAVGKPLGGSKSGMQVVIVRDDRLEHHYYDFGDLPVKIEFDQKPAAETKSKAKAKAKAPSK